MAKKNGDQNQQQATGADQGTVQDPPPNDAGAGNLEQVNEAAIWDELGDEEAAAKTESDDATKGSSDAGAAASDNQNDQGAANQQAASDDAATAGGKATGKAAASQNEDIWANATPAQQAAFKAAQEAAQKGEQYRRSNDGRIAALQRKVDELARNPAATAAGVKGKMPTAEELLNDPELIKTAKEYPEIAGPFIKTIGKMQELLTGHGKVLSAIGDERRQAALNEQQQTLAAAHEDWEAVASREEFPGWLAEQPRHIREAFHRNANDIVDAQEAADVIGRFKDHLRANGQYQDAEQDGGNNAQQQNGTQANGAGNDQLDAKRQRQRQSASSTRTRGPSVASGIPEDGDPKALWNQFDELDRRKAAQNRA